MFKDLLNAWANTGPFTRLTLLFAAVGTLVFIGFTFWFVLEYL